MPNVLLLIKNELLADDLAEQLSLKKFAVYKNIEEDVFDVFICDNEEDFEKTTSKLYNTPCVFISEDNKSVEADYLIKKPILLESMLDIVSSAANSHSDTFLKFGSYLLDTNRKEIENTLTTKIVKLTEREVDIIKYLYKTQERVVDKNELLSKVWEYHIETTTHTVETHIYRLRQKVEEDGQPPVIITKEAGYSLNI